MVFSSISFLFFFLPISLLFSLALWRFAKPSRRVFFSNLVLLVSSLIFYAWGEGKLVALLFGSSSIDYLAGIAMTWRSPDQKLRFSGDRNLRQKAALFLAISTNLLILCYFKYFHFFLNTFFSEDFLNESFGGLEIALPLGISFYTFQSMSYSIDVYRGAVPATRNFMSFLTYVSLFPQLVAGPIVRYRDVAGQMINRRVNLNLIESGIQRFVIGLGKKVLIANHMGWIADRVFELPEDSLSFTISWVGALAYTFQIYFDFSGYSDMAIGLGRIFGFQFLENFNYPYISRSIQSFWRRWHISLSSWFRDYLYIPLGGNKKGLTRTYFNLVVVFFFCGLWHGASWNYVIWGLYHGLLLILERTRFGIFVSSLPTLFAHIYVGLAVVIGWVIFRIENLENILPFLMSMLNMTKSSSPVGALSEIATLESFLVGLMAIVGSTPLLRDVYFKLVKICRLQQKEVLVAVLEFLRVGFLLLVLLASMVWISAGTYNPFIYFRF